MNTGIELYSLIQKTKSANLLLRMYDGDDSKQGNIYEKLWDLVIKFGYCQQYPNNLFSHYNGNLNQHRMSKVKNLKNYLENLKIFSRNEGGSSDITLKNAKENNWVFFSSKFFRREKDLDKYDIEKIVSAVSDRKTEYAIVLLVRDTKKLKEKIKKSQNPIKNQISNILDLNDLELCYSRLHTAIQGVEFNRINDIFGVNLPPIQYRFHQELTIHKTLEQIKNGSKQFLIAHKPRSGKTYTFGGIFYQYWKSYSKLNALIISAVPNETNPQYKDLFNSYRDFSEFNVCEFRSGTNIRDVQFSKNRPNILIVSKQLLDDLTGEQTAMNIRNLELDFIVFDESHFHGTTTRARDIIQSYSIHHTLQLYVTATYNKPLLVNNIPEKCRSYWDLEDEQFCKNRDEKSLKMKHGKDIHLFLHSKSTLNSYDTMPDLHLLTLMMQPEIIERIRSNIQDTPYGFSMNALFSLTTNQKQFKYVQEVDDLLECFVGKQGFIRDENCMFERIRNISQHTNSRTMNGALTTQLWFLPYGCGMNIDKVSRCLKDRILKNKTFKKHYQVLIVNSTKEYRLRDPKTEIEKTEKEAKSKNKSLIILAGCQLVLGISLPFVDTVVLLNSSTSADRIIQMMYRSMTESGNKKNGYVIDINISRVLNVLLEYPIQTKNTLNPLEKIRYIIENKLINIDSDLFSFRNISSEILIQRLVDIWNSQPKNAIQNLQRQFSESVVSITQYEQKQLDKYFKNIQEKNTKKIKMDETDSEPLPKGIHRRSENSPKRNKNETHISLTRDILCSIISLSCVLTMHTSSKSLIEKIDEIQSTNKLFYAFKEQINIWWGEKDLDKRIDIIFEMIHKYFKENPVIDNIIMQFTTVVQSLIDTPDKCLEFIHESLKPKQTEKKKHGEVFTPPALITEMLDRLPLEVWNNPSLKWFDPAGGMGNFLVMVYLRLMQGLEAVFPDPESRKKHILQHQIYMSELNPKNTIVYQRIFNAEGRYSLNLYEGDTLELDPVSYWGVERFDIIVGNPPYNHSGERATGNTIWQKFTRQSIQWLVADGYLAFIHPNGWRKPNTPRGKFNGLWDLMTRQNTLQYLEIHNERDGQKIFNCGTRYDWYVLQKTLPSSEHKTLICDQEGVYWNLDLSRYKWLANCKLDWIDRLLADQDQERCRIIQSMSAYDPRKEWISKTESEEFKYPVIHSTPQSGTRMVWSNRNDNGHYGISKVVFGDSGIYNIVVDLEGQYAMTQHAMAIQVSNLEEASIIKAYLESESFKQILNACTWSSFAIEWNMFSDFRRDFYTFVSDK